MLSVKIRERAIATQNLQYEDIGLGEIKQRLPLGIWLPSGKRIREYSLHHYDGYADLSLGSLEDENEDEDDRLNRIYCEFISTRLKSLKGYSLETIATQFEISPYQVIGNFYLADAIALILKMRLGVWGKDIAVSGVCPCPEQFKIRGGEKHGYHNLESVIVRTLPDSVEEPPIFRIDLEDGFTWNGDFFNAIYLEPPRFNQILELADDLLPLDVRLLFTCSVHPKVTPSIYWQLSPDDLSIIRQEIDVVYFGPDRKLEMDCPKCGLVWDQPLDLGGAYENFYCSLMSAPRMKREAGATEAYLDEIAFALSYGEDVSLTREDVLKMSPQARDRFINKVSEQRKKQKEEMDKANAQAKAKSKR
jgi:hypothetical protein